MHHLNHLTTDMSIDQQQIYRDDNHRLEQMYSDAPPGSDYHYSYGQRGSSPYTQYAVVSSL